LLYLGKKWPSKCGNHRLPLIKYTGEYKMIRVPTHRAPTHPGEMLLEEFLKPMGLTQRELASAINVPYQRVNEIINGKRGITPSTALRLSKVFKVSADFWMNIQLRWDLYFAKIAESDDLKSIRPIQISQLDNQKTHPQPGISH
jgi:addiction module HigA family antidote